MNDRIVFLNTGWMDFYNGIAGDPITGGGKHVETEGWGGEMYNFKPFKNKFFGYVQPKIDTVHQNPSTIKLEKIGGLETDPKIDNVTVVWTARDPNKGGTYIVGWYKKATVYRYRQSSPKNSNRNYMNISLDFYATANAEDSTLLPVDERIVNIRRQEKNEFVKLVKDYIFETKIPKQPDVPTLGKGTPRQLDPLKRIQVEKSAVEVVTNYYRELGYVVESFEKDNVGWDLTATNNRIQLKLEVKGLSGSITSTELTPNEYKNLKADKRFYRLCIVTDALVEPKLRIFAYSNDNKEWASGDGTILRFEEVISARVYV
jgi:Domain of unknown function (DUF3883)